MRELKNGEKEVKKEKAISTKSIPQNLTPLWRKARKKKGWVWVCDLFNTSFSINFHYRNVSYLILFKWIDSCSKVYSCRGSV